MRWAVDYPDDFAFIVSVFDNNLYPKYGNQFSYEMICDLLKQKPELSKINSGHIRNEKFLAQLNAYKEIQKQK